MTSINAATGSGNNHQYIAQLQNVQRPQVQVPASSVRDTADSFTSSFKQKVSGIEDPKTLYTVKSRYDQILEKLTQGTQSPDGGAFSAASDSKANTTVASLVDGPVTPDGSKLNGSDAGNTAGTSETEGTDAGFTTKDLHVARDLLGAREGDENFNARYDIDEDGEISFSDLVGMLSRFGSDSSEDSGQGSASP